MREEYDDTARQSEWWDEYEAACKELNEARGRMHYAIHRAHENDIRALGAQRAESARLIEQIAELKAQAAQYVAVYEAAVAEYMADQARDLEPTLSPEPRRAWKEAYRALHGAVAAVLDRKGRND